MRDDQSQFQRIPMTQIDEPPHQLRVTIDPERLGELADSMAAEGLHQPIGVTGPTDGGTYTIIWGHRRFLAARLLLWGSIDARVFPRGTDPLLAAITENLQRVDLDPVEEALAVRQMLDQGRAIAEISRLFRRSAAWVSMRLELLGFHEDVRQAIQKDGLKLTVAQALQDVDHDEYRQELIREALRSGASGPTAQIWRQHYLADRDRIVSNHLVIEEIKSRREAWVIYVPCEACHKDTDYRETESWRFCIGCSRDLKNQIREAQAELNASPLPSSPTAPTPRPQSLAGIEQNGETRG